MLSKSCITGRAMQSSRIQKHLNAKRRQPLVIVLAVEVLHPAFKTLAAEVEVKVVHSTEVVRLSSLRKQFDNIQEQEGGPSTSCIRNDGLKRLLIRNFGTKIQFWNPPSRQQSELVYGGAVPPRRNVHAHGHRRRTVWKLLPIV